jgi:hypothetical protein
MTLTQPFDTIRVAKHRSGTNPMTIVEKLNEIKEQIISNLETKAKHLERDRPSFKAHPEQLKAYNADRETALKALSLAHGRLPSYRVRGTVNYNCPQCWLIDGVQSVVDSRSGGTRTADFWRCDTCGLEVEVTRGI